MRSDRCGRESGAAGDSPGESSDPVAAPVEYQSGEEPCATVPEDPEQRARDIVYRLLAVRARSYTELHQALLRKGVDGSVADSVLAKFVAAGLVDDAAFAAEWVHARRRSQGLGRRALAFELHRKGIDAEIVESVLSTVDEDEEVVRARELVRRKLRTTRDVDFATQKRRLLGLLARKGYSEALAFRVVREELEESGMHDLDENL